MLKELKSHTRGLRIIIEESLLLLKDEDSLTQQDVHKLSKALCTMLNINALKKEVENNG